MSQPVPVPTFGARLTHAVTRRRSSLVLGLDPHPATLWRQAHAAVPSSGSAAAKAGAAVAAHCALLIDAAGPACVAVKPQLACFERLGAAGWDALGQVVEHAHRNDLLVIADGKRGDVPVTAQAYAEALLGAIDTPWGVVTGLGADAVTVNPLLGLDAIEPLIAAARAGGNGVFLLVRTSNPGAVDVEDGPTADGSPLWETLAAIADQVGVGAPLADVGAVMGATVPEHLVRARELMPRTPFLLPGVGAQGGRVEELAPAFAPGAAGGLVTASRAIANAGQDADNPAEAAREEAERLRAAAASLAS